MFPLFSFRLSSALEIGVPPRHRPHEIGEISGFRPSPAPPAMVDMGPPWPPQLVAEALGNGSILGELDAILADHSRTILEDRKALSAEKRSVWGIHSFLTQLTLGLDPVPGLDRVTLVGVDLDVMVHLMHSILSVWVDIYLAIRRLFSCLGDLPAKGLPLVVDIPHEAFSAQRSVLSIPPVDHVTHLGGVSPPYWQKNPCKRVGKTAGTYYFDLDLRGLTFVTPDFAAWLLEWEVDGPLNVLEALKGLLPLITGREPPFEEALDFLQFAYTADREGGFVEPAYTVLAQSEVADGGELFLAFLAHLRRLYPEVCVPVVYMGWSPEYREFSLGKGEGLIGVNSVNIFIKLGAYTGRFNHLNLAGMNNPSPNLTTV